jgi:hypothetical protein
MCNRHLDYMKASKGFQVIWAPELYACWLETFLEVSSRGESMTNPSIVLEAVVDRNLCMWHASFGTPGTQNDIHIWDQLPLLKLFLLVPLQNCWILSLRLPESPFLTMV